MKKYTTDELQQLFATHLEKRTPEGQPNTLYDPIHYILNLGGKRIRPTATLLACSAYGGKPAEALDAAMAVEVFHNFSLLHDDIMDEAPLRRGQQTVHLKWNRNTAILSGDAMLIEAYRFFEDYPAALQVALIKCFNQTALEVCKGQQYDMDFEQQASVSLEAYIQMITYKTAVLLAASFQMGALVAGASEASQARIYAFGKYLGLAFQIQDDYLDAFGNPETFGKQVGGDILENKKTFLYIKALEKADEAQTKALKHLFAATSLEAAQKIAQTLQLFEQTGAKQEALDAIAHYTQKAFEQLQGEPIDKEVRLQLEALAAKLQVREA